MFKNLFSLQSRVALVTGGSRGIRQDDSSRISQPGRCESLPHGAQGRTVRGDRERTHGRVWRRMRRAADRHFQPCRHRNAGSRDQEVRAEAGYPGQQCRRGLGVRIFDEFPESGWDKVMNLNVKTPFFLTKALAAPLRAAATAERSPPR